MTKEELVNLKRGDIIHLTGGAMPAKVLHACPVRDVIVIEMDKVGEEAEANGWNNDGMAVIDRMECYIPEDI